jgi:hypothetical protein
MFGQLWLAVPVAELEVDVVVVVWAWAGKTARRPTAAIRAKAVISKALLLSMVIIVFVF